MKILIAASEMAPYVKSGGLGDVVGALPDALSLLGHEVKVFIPRFGLIDGNHYKLRPYDWSGHVTVGNKKHQVSLEKYRHAKSGVEIYFVTNEHFFDRGSLYLDSKTGKDYVDNDERFVFFAKAVLESAQGMNWQPDIVHAHDWQAGMIPVYLKTILSDDTFYSNCKSVLTIHNLAYQGCFPSDRFTLLGLSQKEFYATSPFEFYGKVNFLKAAIMHADWITTVSKTYAREIQSSSELGCGLEGVLKERNQHLTGIVNGVDYHTWSPSRDRKIPYRYHRANLSGKKANKVELLNRAALPVRDKIPLVGIISRLVDQKGFDLIAESIDRMMALGIQMIVLGTGEDKYHRLFEEAEQCYPDRIKAYLTFDDSLAHHIEAASDIFLMPSKFEPCGLNQMYSLKYGTVPVVRKVGGLADTVTDYDLETMTGTGFVFDEYTPEAMVAALSKAVTTYSQRRVWTKIVKAGMKQDFSWNYAAGEYNQLYEMLLKRTSVNSLV